MIYSKVGICNLALAAIGEDSIRDFDDGNKRARMCDVFYETTRDYLLSQFDWAFARKQVELQQLAESPDYMPESKYAYGVPSDCHNPLDLYPQGGLQVWEIRGQTLYCPYDSADDVTVVLIYTKKEIDPTKFTAQFVNLLSLALATRICAPLTQDSQLSELILKMYETEKREVWSNDASIGNKYLNNNEDPNLDSFVDADFAPNSGITYE